MGPKKKRSPQTVFAFGKYWARPLRHGTRHVRTLSMGYQKPFPKRFLRSFFLKKATPAPAGAPPINQNLNTVIIIYHAQRKKGLIEISLF
jgi:hypothetical protein